MRPKSPYESLLDSAKLSAIGEITVALGHIDEMMGNLISTVFRVHPDTLDKLVGDITLGSKERIVRKCISRVADAKVASEIKEFCDLMAADIIPKRNLMTHGCWGRYTDDWVTYRSGAYSSSKPKGRFYADELPDLFESVCRAAWLLVQVLESFGVLAAPDRYAANFTWSTLPGEPTSGTWLQGSVIKTIDKP